MVKGAIYKRVHSDVMFAYRGEDSWNVLHYVCLLPDGVVVIKNVNGIGEIGKEECRPATPTERERFLNAIHDFGYHYNEANHKVINLTTKEIIEQ